MIRYFFLYQAFDVKNDWNHKNRERQRHQRWETQGGGGGSCADFAHSPKDYLLARSTRFGWLVDLVNAFGERGGFDLVHEWFIRSCGSDSRQGSGGDSVKEPPSLSALASLLAPMANCAELLDRDAFQKPLTECLGRVFQVVGELKAAELKSKDIAAVMDLISSAKLLCLNFLAPQASKCDEARLTVVVDLLKAPQFHSKMSALKEVSRLIEESKQRNKKCLTAEDITKWMSDHSVLSVALEGNIDQVQYTERLQAIVEFLGPKLEKDELTKMWSLAEGAANVHVADNVFGMLAASCSKLSLEQFEHLSSLVSDSWGRLAGRSSAVRGRERLLALVGRMGREASAGKCLHLVLELLWELSHRPGLDKYLVETALSEQLAILTEQSYQRDKMKREYVLKCVEDVKRSGDSVALAVKHLFDICQSYLRGSSLYNKADKATLGELNKQHEIVKLLTGSLRRCLSKMAATSASSAFASSPCSKLDGSVLYDGRYTKAEVIHSHLDLLKFLLKEGDLYLSKIRCEELWDTLVANQQRYDTHCAYRCYLYNYELCHLFEIYMQHRRGQGCGT